MTVFLSGFAFCAVKIGGSSSKQITVENEIVPRLMNCRETSYKVTIII